MSSNVSTHFCFLDQEYLIGEVYKSLKVSRGKGEK